MACLMSFIFSYLGAIFGACLHDVIYDLGALGESQGNNFLPHTSLACILYENPF